MQIALYKGPPSDILHVIGHNAIKLWTWSKYSHAELVIDGYCYSSSARDGGVRRKKIDLTTGRWDIFEITENPDTVESALAWFNKHDGDPYDYRNIVRFVLPPVGQNKKHWVCFESIGAALGIKNAHKLDADKLLSEALRLHKDKPKGEAYDT